MYNSLRLYVDSVLSHKVPWELSILPPKMLALIDNSKETAKITEQKHNDYVKNGKTKNANTPKQYATESMYIYLRNYATEATLIRAITGSDYRVEVAKVGILETIQWRVNSRVDEISPLMFEEAIKKNIIYSFNKRDKK
eukprot:376984_1